MEYVKTFVLLAIFLLMAVTTVISNFRHHKEKKQLKKEGKLQKKPSRLRKLMFWKKNKQQKNAAIEKAAIEELPDTESVEGADDVVDDWVDDWEVDVSDSDN